MLPASHRCLPCTQFCQNPLLSHEVPGVISLGTCGDTGCGEVSSRGWGPEQAQDTEHPSEGTGRMFYFSAAVPGDGKEPPAWWQCHRHSLGLRVPGDAVLDLGAEAQVGARHLLCVVLVKALALGDGEVVLPVPSGAWGRARWGSAGTEGTRWDRALGTLTFAHERGDALVHEV